MSRPVYKIEVYDPTPTLRHTITKARRVYYKDVLTSSIGIFGFSVPTKKNGTIEYEDIAKHDIVKIWLDTLTGDPDFAGRVVNITGPLNTEQGWIREITGLDNGEILLRRHKKNRVWDGVGASTIVEELADDLGLGKTKITADATSVDKVVETSNYFNVLRELSDYWYDAGSQIKKDFRVDSVGDLVWKTRPLRTVDVETFAVGTNILRYRVVRSVKPVFNSIDVYGAAERRHPELGSTPSVAKGEWNYVYIENDDVLHAHSNLAYQLVTTHMKSADSDTRVLLYRVALDVYFTGAGTGAYYKLTYQKEGGAETVIVTDQFFDNGAPVTKTHQFYVAGDQDKDLTIRVYTKIHDTGVANSDEAKMFYNFCFGLWVTDGIIQLGETPGFQYYEWTTYSMRSDKNAADSMYLRFVDDTARLAMLKGYSRLRTALRYQMAGAVDLDTCAIHILAPDTTDYFSKNLYVDELAGGPHDDVWNEINLALGPGLGWDRHGSAKWNTVTGGSVLLTPAANCDMAIWLDDPHLAKKRWFANANALPSSAYGQRDLEVVNDRLLNDAQCKQRAEALLFQKKDMPIQIELTVKGNMNVKVGDRLVMTIPAENISTEDFDVFSVEQFVTPKRLTKATMVNSVNIRRSILTQPIQHLRDLNKQLTQLSMRTAVIH